MPTIKYKTSLPNHDRLVLYHVLSLLLDQHYIVARSEGSGVGCRAEGYGCTGDEVFPLAMCRNVASCCTFCVGEVSHYDYAAAAVAIDESLGCHICIANAPSVDGGLTIESIHCRVGCTEGDTLTYSVVESLAVCILHILPMYRLWLYLLAIVSAEGYVVAHLTELPHHLWIWREEVECVHCLQVL